jgi:hypothetical protein
LVLLHKSWGGQFCPQPPSGGFFGLKEIPRTRQASAESRRQPGLAAPQVVQMFVLEKPNGIAHECVRHAATKFPP